MDQIKELTELRERVERLEEWKVSIMVPLRQFYARLHEAESVYESRNPVILGEQEQSTDH